METSEGTETKSTVPRLLALLMAVLITVLILLFRHQLEHFTVYGLLGVFVITLLGNATIIFPVPGLMAAFVGGGIFDPLAVGLVAGVGQTLGELTGYLAGYGGQAVIENRRLYDRLVKWMKRNGDITIFVLAVIPNPVFDLGGMAAGALGFPLWRFLLSCLLGKTVKSLVIAYAGTQSIGLFDKFIP
ncbi:MAG: YqaA family protein [Anaerolineae bacterium]